MAESLLLKWGTLKGWNLESAESKAIAQRYFDLGSSYSCMTQINSAEQTKILCELIDTIEGEISNDWTGETLTKEQAKDYVENYRKKPAK